MNALSPENLSLNSEVKIIFPNGNKLVCRALDANHEGATLSVSSVFGIPDRFHLQIGIIENSIPVKVTWRKPMKLGIALATD